MKRVCIFCGSKVGDDPIYRHDAQELGRLLAQQGMELVFGGGSVGLMGVLADSVLEAGGKVIGVIPQFLATKEIAHSKVTDLRVVPSMHARKALMTELSDAFIALPGGYGTLEELFEVITWAQLGLHGKPVGLLNSGGFFDHLVAFLDHTIVQGFVTSNERRHWLVDPTPSGLLDALARSRPARTPRWLRENET